MTPAGSDPTSLAAEAAGCWELSWRVHEAASTASTGVAPHEELPDSVSLAGSVLFGSDRRLVSPATDPMGRGFTEGDTATGQSWEQRYRVNRWWVDDGQVAVLFSEGDGASWSLTVEPVAGGLEGSAVSEASDGGDASSSTAEVEARPITCPPA